MKHNIDRHRTFWILFRIVFLLFLLPSKVCQAEEDDGFYIEHMEVHVTANTDRTYDIVETIDVNFTDKRHGIIRNIPTTSAMEREIRIEDVNVMGAPFVYDGVGTIKIGDPDKTITGKQQYVISYTIWQYADSVTGADYLYLNLIGTEWTTYIESFDAQIILPDKTTVQKCTLTGGIYGSKESDMASFTTDNNIINVEGTRKLQSGEGVTIQVEMPEGTFCDAKVWTPDIIIHNITADYQLDDHGILSVNKRYDVTLLNDSVLPLSIEESVSDTSIKLIEATVTLPDKNTKKLTDLNTYLNFDSYQGQRIQFNVQYRIAFDVPIGNSSATLHAHLFDYYTNQLLENISVSFRTPFAIDNTSLNRSSYDSSDGSYSADTLNLNMDKTSGELTFSDPSNNARNVYLHLNMDQTCFVRDITIFDWLIPIIALLLVIVLIFVYQHQKPSFNPVPCYYPPEDRNPAEIAYILNNKCLANDIISLIYYWASKGLLQIKFNKKSHFTLTYQKDMDNQFRPYERKLFGHLWKNKKRTTTTDSDLAKKFYVHINHAITSVEKQFKARELQFDPKSVRISKWIGLGLPGIILILLVIADSSRGFGRIGPIVGAGFALPTIIFYYKIITAYRIRKYKKYSLCRSVLKILLTTCFLTFYSLLYINEQVLTPTSCNITFICLIMIACMGPFFKNYSPKRHALLEQVVGFRMFLMTAEKERLKILLDENPDYYYDILPYAQVLGVTKQWIHRFEGLAIQPSTWMHDNRNDLNDYMTLNTLTHTMKSSMTSSPVSSSSNGSYDGGSSGGGSGGGGGSSW
ncbi:DUF2207 family protein [Anaerosporobacter faecicola]|uniref:DUF2207 family protein n=1 Tax=Anaerosporobacter faecicola TaxID=2718714 RepID=UPI001438A18D|nr:DUF2207 domain-containing protein [Anaerosporobacter faecicola]